MGDTMSREDHMVAAMLKGLTTAIGEPPSPQQTKDLIARAATVERVLAARDRKRAEARRDKFLERMATRGNDQSEAWEREWECLLEGVENADE